MTKQEFTNISFYLRTAYPTSNFLPTKESLITWYEELKDLDAEVCMKAMKDYVRNKDYPPTIASIRKSCIQESKVLALPWNEAWDSILKAIKKFGTYGAKDAMDTLDELTKRAVRSIGGFSEICTNSNTAYLRREFKEIYETYKVQYDSLLQASNNPTSYQKSIIEDRLISELK